MRLRNGEHGYGVVTKALHWLTVALLVVQVTLGYAVERADALLEPLADRFFDGEAEGLVLVHAVVGVSLLVVALVRLVWRRTAGLPPWSERLTARDRRVEAAVEKVLYPALVTMPLTGLLLLLASGEDWNLGGDREWRSPWEIADDDVLLGAHIASHLLLYAAVAVHVGLVLRRRLLPRML